jgi:oligopeptide transport system ATP-binding protein
VKHISDRIAVMYLGRVVEIGPALDVFSNPLHPHTRALASAMPIPDPEKESRRRRIILSGDPPSPMNPPSGCPFHPRCSFAVPACARQVPALEDFEGAHQASCMRLREIN